MLRSALRLGGRNLWRACRCVRRDGAISGLVVAVLDARGLGPRFAARTPAEDPAFDLQLVLDPQNELELRRTGEDGGLIERAEVRPVGLQMIPALTLVLTQRPRSVYAAWRRETAAQALLLLAFVLGAGWLLLTQRRAVATMADGAWQTDKALEAADSALWDLNLVTGDCGLTKFGLGLLGLPPETPMTVHLGAWRSRVHPEDLERAQPQCLEHLKGLSPRFDTTCRVRHAQGHWVWLQIRGVAVGRNGQGVAVRMVGTIQDVTDRIRGQEELQAPSSNRPDR